jgi:hypothetical protein
MPTFMPRSRILITGSTYILNPRNKGGGNSNPEGVRLLSKGKSVDGFATVNFSIGKEVIDSMKWQPGDRVEVRYQADANQFYLERKSGGYLLTICGSKAKKAGSWSRLFFRFYLPEETKKIFKIPDGATNMQIISTTGTALVIAYPEGESAEAKENEEETLRKLLEEEEKANA